MVNFQHTIAHIFIASLFLIGGYSASETTLAVDFDAHCIAAEQFLGDSFSLWHVDKDGNGLNEDDQLGMLSTLLAGGENVAALNSTMRSQIYNGYTANLNQVEEELTVRVSIATIDIISEVASRYGDALAQAIQNLLAGLMTIADAQTILYTNRLIDDVVAKVLKGTSQEDYTAQVQSQIDFQASAFATFGNAPTETNYLGATGDVNADGVDNRTEWEQLTEQTRENWLNACQIIPPLRIADLNGRTGFFFNRRRIHLGGLYFRGCRHAHVSMV